VATTGGSIGSGPPLALGAALAVPGRHVINLQADGSAMYTLQALWSQAREGVRVLTVICANSSYSILKVRRSRFGFGGLGCTAAPTAEAAASVMNDDPAAPKYIFLDHPT